MLLKIMKKYQYCVFPMILVLSSCFHDSTDYSFVEKPYLGEYRKNISYKNCDETITLLNESLYVRKLSCSNIEVVDTALYKFTTRPKSESLNKMGISFENWRFLYDEMSYKTLKMDSVGNYSCFYTVENGSKAKFVIHADNRSLDYSLKISR